MSLSIIVAMTEDRVIGRSNQLPWYISEDLIRFKQLTMGHPIIMGRKTYDSIGKPLPGRTNIVLTSDTSKRLDGATIVNRFEDALKIGGGPEVERFVIGGSSLFEKALPLATTLYLTLVHQKIDGDVHFPPFDLEKDFRILEKTDHQSAKGDKLHFSFITAVPR